MMQKEWYDSWFDTRYYHLLYAHRSDTEAGSFIKKICDHIHLKPHAQVLDLACGRGRHSVTLNECGYDVTGMDLSEQSIQFANQFSNQYLRFFVHDSRAPIGNEMYDAVFNLFTSFGYFDTELDNRKMVQSMTRAVKKNGLIIIDFFNAILVEKSLDTQQYKTETENIKFIIQKRIENNFVKKSIEVIDGELNYTFQEQVRLLNLAHFKTLFSSCSLVHTFGDYELNEFIAESSPRLIMIFQK